MEIDPVTLKLVADVDDYIRDVRRAQGDSDRRLRDIENSFRRSSDGISTSLKGIAGTLATAFTGQQLVGLIDQFTRFQNSLKVAGLEGENLATVQERLFQSGSKYGVSVNALADLYGKAEQAGRELGASQSELLSLTDAVAQSLLVSGVSTEQASGAILGLSQALASGTVRAEEFNQINEGGLRVLLEAAAAGDRFGGSINKLRTAVLDGSVSSQEFYRAILANTDLVEGRAAKANLTLSGAITALNDSLARYVGESANANGVTGALAAGIQKLADNLNVIIPALASIATVIGVRYVTALGQAAIANVALQGALAGTATQMGALGAASFALQARLAGAATTTEALTFALRGLSAVAAGALLGGLIYLAATTDDTADATERLTAAADEAEATAALYAKRLRDAGVVLDATGKGADTAGNKVAGFAGQLLNAADAALELADALRVADLAKIGAQITENRAQQARLQSIETNRPSKQSSGSPQGLIGQGVRDYVVPLAEKITGEKARGPAGTARQLAELKRQELALQETARIIAAGAAAGVDVTRDRSGPAAPSATGKANKTRTPKSASGPNAADIEARYRDELDSIRIRIQAAEGERARTAEERAEYEGRQLEFAEDMALRQVDLDKDLSDAQKAEIKARLLALGEAERDNIEFRKRTALEREAADLLEERGRAQVDALRLQFDLADTEAERRRIALQILDAENDLLRSKLEAIIASDTAAKVDQERARIALAALNAQEPGQRASTERQFEGPLARFARSAKDADTRVEEAAVRRIQDLNQTITDAMTNALGIKDPFLSQLIRIFLDKNVFGPLAEALNNPNLQGNGGGIVGGIVSVFGGLFGRASGGRVNAGGIYRVNEGASPGRVEAFVPNTSGQIIPLGRMNAMQTGGGAQGGTVRVVIEEAPGFAARVRTEAAGVAVEVVRQSAPQIVDAAANETFRRANRPGL